MSPEQVMGNRKHGGPARLVCGVILYQMCTGQMPFEDEQNYDLFEKIVKHDPSLPRA